LPIILPGDYLAIVPLENTARFQDIPLARPYRARPADTAVRSSNGTSSKQLRPPANYAPKRFDLPSPQKGWGILPVRVGGWRGSFELTVRPCIQVFDTAEGKQGELGHPSGHQAYSALRSHGPPGGGNPVFRIIRQGAGRAFRVFCKRADESEFRLFFSGRRAHFQQLPISDRAWHGGGAQTSTTGFFER